jgi:hypothetical protein
MVIGRSGDQRVSKSLRKVGGVTRGECFVDAKCKEASGGKTLGLSPTLRMARTFCSPVNQRSGNLQHDLAVILAFLDECVSRARILEQEDLPNHGTQFAVR